MRLIAKTTLVQFPLAASNKPNLKTATPTAGLPSILWHCIPSREPAMNDFPSSCPTSSQSTSVLEALPSSAQVSSSLATMDVTVLQALRTLAGDGPFLV